MSVGSIPYSSTIKTDNPDLERDGLCAHLMCCQNKILSFQPTTSDRRLNPNKDTVLGLYGFMGLQNQLDRHWSIGYGLGAHTPLLPQ
ncbi:hypothetical protein O9992_30850 [Vibrio lentus]|nr:hypothetical protein [Vibrio lentus]